MRRALLCCLLVLLTACADSAAPTTVAPSATAGRSATATMQPMPPPPAVASAKWTSVAGGARPCPAGQPVRGVGTGDGSLRAVVPGETDYERLPWLRCFATVEEAVAAGFLRQGARGTVVAAPGTPPAPGSVGEELALVVRVIDALTIEVRLGDGEIETVRHLGVDLPTECDGSAGSAHNATLVVGRTVRLERDVSERDRFERLLRYVWVVGDDGVSRLANEEVVRDGFASAAIVPPDVKYEQRLLAAAREAFGAGRGLWIACAGHLVPSACHPSYPTLCLPGSPDLDCADVPQKAFPVRPPDPHGLDGYKDGIGCEN